MKNEEPIVKDIVTKNEIINKFSEFIGKDTFSSLASCATIVGLMVQFFKAWTPLPPILLSFICSTIISGIKLVLSGDYTKDNIILSIINILPISLTASGGYDVVRSITG